MDMQTEADRYTLRLAYLGTETDRSYEHETHLVEGFQNKTFQHCVTFMKLGRNVEFAVLKKIRTMAILDFYFQVLFLEHFKMAAKTVIKCQYLI